MSYNECNSGSCRTNEEGLRLHGGERPSSRSNPNSSSNGFHGDDFEASEARAHRVKFQRIWTGRQQPASASGFNTNNSSLQRSFCVSTLAGMARDPMIYDMIDDDDDYDHYYDL